MGSVLHSPHPFQSSTTGGVRPMIRLIPFAADMGVAAVGVAAGAQSSIDWVALATAISAGIYLICKGAVLVIREIRKK